MIYSGLEYALSVDIVEKDIAVMKQDIIYKLDETNTAVGILKGALENQGHDIKHLINQTKSMALHLDSLDMRIDSVDKHLEVLDKRLNSLEEGVNTRFEALDKKLDQVLAIVSTLMPKRQPE